MSVYKRFISYMFSYENGVKKENVGYARIENYNEECRVHIYMKDSVKREQKASVYLFYRDADRIQGIYMKEMTILDGVGECKITTGNKNIGGTNCNFENIGGIIVYITANRFWGTEWDDKPIYGFEPKVSELKEIRLIEDKAKGILSEQEEEIELQAAVLEKNEESYEEQKRYYEEYADCTDNLGLSDKDTRDGLNESKDCFTAYTKLYPFYEPDKECIGISPNELCDISPMLEKWQKNDFVKYGYGRFRHIILLRKESEPERCFIGVPGMYRQEEERMAVTYGFERFIPVRKENAEYGDFGYWCAEITL